jgi:hypothetical protein
MRKGGQRCKKWWINEQVSKKFDRMGEKMSGWVQSVKEWVKRWASEKKVSKHEWIKELVSIKMCKK